jgi:hypothetical protein
LAGEQAQVDWGHFGKIEIGKAKRPLMAFVRNVHEITLTFQNLNKQLVLLHKQVKHKV